jgi:site-specific recombinase XerC
MWEAHQRGYTSGTARNMLKGFGQLGRWLLAEGLEAAQLDGERVAGFLDARQLAGQRRVPGLRGTVALLSYLREAGVVPVAKPLLTPLGALLGQYRSWLVQERGLAATTVLRYENTAGRFLRERALAGDVFEPTALTGVEVSAFLLKECGRVSAGSAKGRVAELRSILRFLYLWGITPLRLGTAVPPVGGWRLATLAPTMTAANVQSLLDSCDRGSTIGVRDFAMMMLVARLGLRSIEVARLELRDVDWRAGELVVRSKGRREDRLPLPTEVGEALVAYLSRGRATEYLTAMHTGGRAKTDIDAGQVLPGYTGTIVRDGYAGYAHLIDAHHAWCGAHYADIQIMPM